MTAYKPQFSTFNALLAGGLMFTLLGLMIDVQTRTPNSNSIKPFAQCDGAVQVDVVLSQTQLAQILTVSERDSKDKIRDILATPYCVLPSVEIRSGVTAEREVYPLAFAANTWLILLFEEDEYAGYRISTQP